MFEKRQVSYIHKGIYFGEFDAEVCIQCGHTFFPEESFHDIEQIAKEKGLWGIESKWTKK